MKKKEKQKMLDRRRKAIKANNQFSQENIDDIQNS